MSAAPPPASAAPAVPEAVAVPEREPDNPVLDTPEFLAAFRAEISRRTTILRAERAKLPKSAKKHTAAQIAHLHTFAFTHESVKEAVLGNL